MECKYDLHRRFIFFRGGEGGVGERDFRKYPPAGYLFLRLVLLVLWLLLLLLLFCSVLLLLLLLHLHFDGSSLVSSSAKLEPVVTNKAQTIWCSTWRKGYEEKTNEGETPTSTLMTTTYVPPDEGIFVLVPKTAKAQNRNNCACFSVHPHDVACIQEMCSIVIVNNPVFHIICLNTAFPIFLCGCLCSCVCVFVL